MKVASRATFIQAARGDLDPRSGGQELGRIVHGYPATNNIGFGGDDWKTLYFVSRTVLGVVNVKIPGIPVPAQKRS